VAYSYIKFFEHSQFSDIIFEGLLSAHSETCSIYVYSLGK